jgi:fumarate hydratase class I
MTVIRQDDFIDSVADALQFISYYHPLDYIQAVHRAWEMEVNPAAKDAMAQILINSRMCAEGHRPICQDTGIVVVFLKVGMEVRWDASWVCHGDGQRGRAPRLHAPGQRAARLDGRPPHRRARNTGDNTPAIVHMEVVPGDTVDVRVAAKGGGSENKSKLRDAQPERFHRRLGGEDRADHGRRLVPAGHARHRHRRYRGEGHAVLAKESLMDPIDIHDSRPARAGNPIEELRLEMFDAVNAPRHRRPGSRWPDHGGGREDQGLSDPRCVLPVAMIPNCAATRHIALRARR